MGATNAGNHIACAYLRSKPVEVRELDMTTLSGLEGARAVRSRRSAAASSPDDAALGRLALGEPRLRHRSAGVVLAQQVGELARVVDRVVLVAVVQQHVDLARVVGKMLDPRDPLPQLALLVEVAEA